MQQQAIGINFEGSSLCFSYLSEQAREFSKLLEVNFLKALRGLTALRGLLSSFFRCPKADVIFRS